MATFAKIILSVWLLIAHVNAFAVSTISITAERISHPQLEAQHASVRLNLQQAQPQLVVNAALKKAADKDWAQLQLNCNMPQLAQLVRMRCSDGLLQSPHMRLPFSLQLNRLHISPQLDTEVVFALKQASFSDEAGLHAAEKLSGTLNIALKQTVQAWQWRTTLDWQSGELFWQPFYVANGGHLLVANGSLDDNFVQVEAATLHIHKVGDLAANGQLRLHDLKLTQLQAKLSDLDLNTAYPLIFKPFLEKTAFNQADISGRASLNVQIKDSALKAFDLQLRDVNIIDKNQKFAFNHINASVPWDYDEMKTVRFGYENGALLNLPLGKTQLEAEVNRYAISAPMMRLPILDGSLRLSDISAAYIDQAWYWHLSAALEPVSMEMLSTQLKLPRMVGKASAQIPLVTYNGGNLTTDGSVVLNVFGGTATVTQLTMQTPLGNTPKLNADIALRNLDLGDLTRTFSFGAIEGKLDGDVENLIMQNWQPIAFDAAVQSSPGHYPKKISQRAVENISALGGGGAAAAVQRSVLRFFSQFNYGKMGLSCKLRNDICTMGGVESTPQGYIIVKGSGIPAITVMGYNQTVAWSDLLARVKRVIDGNSKAIIQ